MPDTLALTPSQLKRRWRSAAPEERRELIIEAAMSLLAKRGPEAVTMRRVAARLGVGAMTLYTYINGQDEMRREMTRRGFQLLADGCSHDSTLEQPDGWLGRSRHYLRFAVENPRLYELMFATPLPAGDADEHLLLSGIQPLLDRVRERLERAGWRGDDLDREALDRAGRYWIGLHGLASLAIAGRLGILRRDTDDLLRELIQRVAPD